jgi:hypothetical protein
MEIRQHPVTSVPVPHDGDASQRIVISVADLPEPLTHWDDDKPFPLVALDDGEAPTWRMAV